MSLSARSRPVVLCTTPRHADHSSGAARATPHSHNRAGGLPCPNQPLWAANIQMVGVTKFHLKSFGDAVTTAELLIVDRGALADCSAQTLSLYRCSPDAAD